MFKRILFFILISCFTFPAIAQDLPFLGPVIAINTVEQDHIVLYDVESGRYRELSLGVGDHHVWDFSPDGCEILLTLAQGTQPAKLYRVDLQGNNVLELILYDELESTAWGVWEPDWSPNGRRIAFTMIRNQQSGNEIERTTHIAWIDANGSQPEFYSVTGSEFAPTWSPNSEWLAYVSYNERVPGSDVLSTAVPTLEPANGVIPPEPTTINEADLWVVSADGTTKYPLTQFRVGSVSKPRWSPDGELVSFVYSVSGSNDMFWMIANQQNAIPTQLSFRWSMILDTTWLPDSTHIIGSARDFRDVAENRLWQVSLVGNADETAILYLQNAELSHADYPRFSPDGNYLASRTGYEIALVDTRTQETQLLDARTIGNTPVVWSPTSFTDERDCE